MTRLDAFDNEHPLRIHQPKVNGSSRHDKSPTDIIIHLFPASYAIAVCGLFFEESMSDGIN